MQLLHASPIDLTGGFGTHTPKSRGFSEHLAQKDPRSIAWHLKSPLHGKAAVAGGVVAPRQRATMEASNTTRNMLHGYAVKLLSLCNDVENCWVTKIQIVQRHSREREEVRTRIFFQNNALNQNLN